MSGHKDYYAILGVRPDADGQAVQVAYERLARQYQPDADKEPPDAAKMAELDEAFDVLDDRQRRAQYDRARGIAPVRRGWRAFVAPLEISIAVAAAAVAVIVGVEVLRGDGSQPADVPLRIISPGQDSTVKSPLTLEVASSGFLIAPAEAQIAGAVHYHAFVNIHPFTPEGEVIPHEEGVHHFGGDTLELDLPPGFYTIIVALGDNSHVRLRDAPVSFVDFTVEE